MHLATFYLLGLSAGALSLPTVDSTPTKTTLDKRFAYGWVGNFDHAGCDPNSMVNGSVQTPVHRGDCVPVGMQWGDYVGIDWGVGKNHGFSTLAAYMDTACETQVAEVKNTLGQYGACLPLSTFTEGSTFPLGAQYGAVWDSVKAIN